MKTENKKCEFCDKIFSAAVKELNRGNARFCSRSCGAQNQAGKSKNRPKKFKLMVCAYCNSDFKKYKASKSKSGLYFCTRKCKDTAQRIENGFTSIQPHHYGDEKTRYGHRKLAFRYKKAICENCGYSKYKGVLEVHHIDRDRSNNVLENLEILCPTCHTERHYESRSGKFGKNKKTGD